MTLSLIMALLIGAAAPDTSWRVRVVESVTAHYDSLLTGKAETWQIEIKRLPELRCGEFRVERVWERESDTTVPRGSRLCWVEALVDGKPRSLPVNLSVEPVELVPTAKLDLPARSPLDAGDIVWKSLPTEEFGAALFPRPEQIANLWTRTSIPAGTVLTMKRLDAKPEVVAGDEVTLVSNFGNVEVRAAGKSLENGLIGDCITAVNRQSGQRIKGLVKADKTVVVK